ncbi:MAG TPA: DUF2188 domain-containing protein [Verrucomicrobiales bacterium]|nr:DUF2188 domain-containing protein [Verrucomicrobiales bacterium]
MNYYHLRPRKDEWRLTRENSGRVFASCRERSEAIERAAEIVRLRTGVLHIYRADGSLEEKKTFQRERAGI